MQLAQIPARSLAVGPVARLCARGLSSSARQHNQGQSAALPSPEALLSPPSLVQAPQAPDAGRPLAQKLAQSITKNPDPHREIQNSAVRASYQKQIYRKWYPGDVYKPYDLSGQEQKKWKLGRKTPQSDAFDTLGVNPVNEYKNFTMMSEFMTEMGRIKHSRDTGLRPKNQRKIAKAIRRAIGLGLMPSVHRHPLVLKKSAPTRWL
ncbi:ribosomal protein S18 [Corynespora cassiicola Philippines]|uniref:Small ribosomal subunit protein bS18m n=1 Tax=Corynespora cassiicola Philippines TaxID=1448308 RepID=A0A2T2NFJ5_CORCC|nr:ribosomal protein S18 [Corynespora cassiicola Philippines]